MEESFQEQALYVKWQQITSRLDEAEKLLIDLAVFHRSAERGIQRFAILNRVDKDKQESLVHSIFSKKNITDEEEVSSKLHTTWKQLINKLTNSEQLILKLVVFHGDVKQAVQRYVSASSLSLEQQERLDFLFTRQSV